MMAFVSTVEYLVDCCHVSCMLHVVWWSTRQCRTCYVWPVLILISVSLLGVLQLFSYTKTSLQFLAPA
jgi:hypothetical protein